MSRKHRPNAGLLGDDLAEPMHQGDVPPLGLPADVVGLPRARAPHDRPDGGGMVLDVEPVAHVLPLAVDRQTLPFQHVQDHEGDELLGVPLASLGSRAAGVPSSLRSDRSAPLRPLTHTASAANNRTTPLLATIAQHGPYRIVFYSGDRDELPQVHVLELE